MVARAEPRVFCLVRRPPPAHERHDLDVAPLGSSQLIDDPPDDLRVARLPSLVVVGHDAGAAYPTPDACRARFANASTRTAASSTPPVITNL
jgi:hypothetical protein